MMSLASSAGVSVGPHQFVGRYDLTFPQDVSRCAFVATSGLARDLGVAGPAADGIDAVIQGGYYVPRERLSVLETRDGVPTDAGFSVVAYC